MEVKIKGNEIRIIGKSCAGKRYLKIYVIEEDGKDTYSLSTIKDGGEHGNLPMIQMDKDNIIMRDHGNKRFID